MPTTDCNLKFNSISILTEAFYKFNNREGKGQNKGLGTGAKVPQRSPLQSCIHVFLSVWICILTDKILTAQFVTLFQF